MNNSLEVLANARITNNCKGNKCSNCGECCVDFIPLTKNEVKNIKSYIKKHNIKENVYVTEEHFDARCPFYVQDSDHHCSIYPVRPRICRTFKCNQSLTTMANNKEIICYEADYNKFYNNSFHKTYISLHNLFYGNYKHELQALYCLANFNDDAFKALLSECLIKYEFSNE